VDEADPVPATRGLSIVLADDNRDSAESLKMLLELEGHAVQAAHDGEEAFALVESVRPRVVLLDIGMPKLNGYEVAAKIRMQAWGRELRLIALTGWGQSQDRRRAAEAGFDHHLTKPVELDTVLSLVRQAES
jgi:CheY-like chemotaxis protein